MKIIVIKKAEVKKSDNSVCPFIIDGVPEGKNK